MAWGFLSRRGGIEGRLWFCNWIDRQIMAVDLDGQAEVMLTRDPASHPMGYSIDWLPDGRLLTTGDKVRRQEPDGSMAVHAEQRANEIVVDARGNAYVNGADFEFVAGAPPKPGYIKLVTPDGQLRQVADDIQFPNGMVITPDGRTLIISESFAGRLTAFDIDGDGGLSGRRVFAEGLGPDGICLDAEGAVWVPAGGFSVVRVAEGGNVLQRVELAENRAPFALMLGGPDRRTLFICTAEWHKADGAPPTSNGWPQGRAPGRSWPCRSRCPVPAGHDRYEARSPSPCRSCWPSQVTACVTCRPSRVLLMRPAFRKIVACSDAEARDSPALRASSVVVLADLAAASTPARLLPRSATTELRLDSPARWRCRYRWRRAAAASPPGRRSPASRPDAA